MSNLEQYENGLALVYKFGERFDGELSAREGINFYALHAKEHNGKVLLTMERGPRKEYRHLIKKIILTIKDGSYAIIADVEALDKGAKIPIPEGYTVPSIWEREPENMHWFALSNVKRTTIEPNTYTSVNGKDLLQSISSHAYMVYVAL